MVFLSWKQQNETLKNVWVTTILANTLPYQYAKRPEHADVEEFGYMARVFDPYLKDFTQPDTIVPDPSNPQSWNRYAYVNNSPINYNDPSGHYAFEEEPNDPFFIPAYQGGYGARRSTKPYDFVKKERMNIIYERGVTLEDGKDSLVSFASLVDFSERLYDDKKETDEMIKDLTCVINGFCGHPALLYQLGIGVPGSQIQGKPFLGTEVFLGKGSWGNKYFDNTDNQMYHFWFYVALSYFDTPLLALFANGIHDPYLSPSSTRDAGVTKMDFDLGVAGTKLGALMNVGITNQSEIGNWIRRELSKNK